jgi:hypothetical protein
VSKTAIGLSVVWRKQIPTGGPSLAFGAASEVERSLAGSSRIAYPASAELLIQTPTSFRSKRVQFALDLVQPNQSPFVVGSVPMPGMLTLRAIYSVLLFNLLDLSS